VVSRRAQGIRTRRNREIKSARRLTTDPNGVKVECARWNLWRSASSRTPASVSGMEERGEKERERERGVSRNTRAHKRSTGPVRSGEVTSPCGLYLRSHSVPALVRRREQSTRFPSSPPCSSTSASSRSWGGTTRREESKLALLPSWDLTGSLSYSRFNRDGFCSYSVAFGLR